MTKRQTINKDFYKEAQVADPLAMNAVLNVGLDETALNHQSKINMQHTFSLELKTGTITSQNKSGRCWLFAGLNTMRYKVMNDLNMKNFELSQTFQMFYDKLEKANYFLENILETLDESTDSRLIMWLLSGPLNDGGQWDMFTAIVEKYGVVPKYVMPESFHSSNSSRMNSILTLKLRGYAYKLRKMSADGSSADSCRNEKEKMLKEFYRLLTTFLGVPPTEFDFEYTDKDDTFYRDVNLTPKSFYEKYLDLDLSEYISVIHAPTQDKPFNKTYTVQYLGNVEGGNPVKYINLDLPEFKALAIAQLKDNVPVWFGSDVGQWMKREEGILDDNAYFYEDVLKTEFDLDKAGRLDYGESLMTHAMVFTGVNLKDAKPNRWKVENSWGDKNGNKGYYVMSDSWFDQFTYQIVVNKKYLTKEQLAAWELEAKVLKPWDPMGALAR